MSAQRAKALELRLELKICPFQPVSSIFNASRLWTPPTRPDQRKRPESGHPLPVQSNASVKNLDALLGSNCVVFSLQNDQSKSIPRGMFPE